MERYPLVFSFWARRLAESEQRRLFQEVTEELAKGSAVTFAPTPRLFVGKKGECDAGSVAGHSRGDDPHPVGGAEWREGHPGSAALCHPVRAELVPDDWLPYHCLSGL